MATGLHMMSDGSVMVAYGSRRAPISRAQYKANGYKPALEVLAAKGQPSAKAPRTPGYSRQDQRARAPNS